MRTRLRIWGSECLAIVSEKKKELVMDSMPRWISFIRYSLRRFDYYGGGRRMALKDDR